jgi:hypothetical protein
MQIGGQGRADAAAGTGNQDHGGSIRHDASRFKTGHRQGILNGHQ